MGGRPCTRSSPCTIGFWLSRSAALGGQGCRVYYTLRGREVVIVLVGGDKSSQAKDIKKAQEIAKEF